ncbi:sensor histidine kinase [Niallia sp. JL1B1071]|uniref:sensor histidine kinase n=1 Tax=Niallia tiangongensis TaxID=3237105 RepID=UPI0037DCD05E
MKKVRLIELLNQRTIRGKFFSLNLLLTLLPMLILGFVVYHISVEKLGERAEEQVASALQMGDHYIQRLYIDLKDVINVITINSEIQDVLNTAYHDDYGYKKNVREVTSAITKITQNKSYITSFVLYSSYHQTDKQLYKRSNARSNTFLNEKQRNQIYSQLLKENNIVWWNNRSLTDFAYDSSSMVIGRVLRNIEKNYEPCGFILLEIEKSTFFEGLSFLNSSRDSNFFVVDNNDELVHYLQTDSASKIVHQKNFLKSFSENEPGTIKSTKIDGEHYIISSERIENMPWEFVYLIQASKFYSDASIIQKVTIGVLFVVFLIGCFIAFVFSKAITSPLNNLAKVINGNKDSEEELQYFNPNDEVGQIGVQFIKMHRENKKLTNQVIQAIVKRKEAEINALQAQINPHFLYNTLDSINWLALSHKQYQISEMISALGNFFRLSLNKGKDNISIKNELDHVMAYIQVQKIRYSDKFEVIVEVDKEIHPYYIPKLLLQPVVENALYHGIKVNNDKGTIMITGGFFEEGICFHITDDGMGMKKDQVEKLNRTLNGENLIPLYGLKNVHNRLRLQFGSAYGVYITSEFSKYTTVSIKVPKLTDFTKEDRTDD